MFKKEEPGINAMCSNEINNNIVYMYVLHSSWSQGKSAIVSISSPHHGYDIQAIWIKSKKNK